MPWLMFLALVTVCKSESQYIDLINQYDLPSEYKMHRSNDHGVVNIEEEHLKKSYHPNHDLYETPTVLRDGSQLFENESAKQDSHILERSIPIQDANTQSIPINALFNAPQISQQNPPLYDNKNGRYENYGYDFSPMEMNHMSPLDLQQLSYQYGNKAPYQLIPLENYHLIQNNPEATENESQSKATQTTNNLPTQQNKVQLTTSQVIIQSTTIKPTTTIFESTNPTSAITNPAKIFIDAGKSNKIDVRPPNIPTSINPIPASTPVVMTTEIPKVDNVVTDSSHHHNHHHKPNHHHNKHTNDISKLKQLPLEQICPDYLTPLERQLCFELTNDLNLTRQHKLAIVNQMQRERIARYAVDRCQWRGRDCQTCLMDLNCAYCPADNHCYDSSFAFQYLVNPSVCYGFAPRYFMTCNVSFVTVFAIIVVVSCLFLIIIVALITLAILLYRKDKRLKFANSKEMLLNTEY